MCVCMPVRLQRLGTFAVQVGCCTGFHTLLQLAWPCMLLALLLAPRPRRLVHARSMFASQVLQRLLDQLQAAARQPACSAGAAVPQGGPGTAAAATGAGAGSLNAVGSCSSSRSSGRSGLRACGLRACVCALAAGLAAVLRLGQGLGGWVFGGRHRKGVVAGAGVSPHTLVYGSLPGFVLLCYVGGVVVLAVGSSIAMEVTCNVA